MDATAPAPIPFEVNDLTQARLIDLGGVLYRADRAWRNNRVYQRMMRHDPDIQHAIGIRTYTTALLPWSVEPEDADDPQQVAECDAISKAIRRIRDLNGMMRTLSEAAWYGAAAAWLKYETLPRPVVGVAKTDEDNPDAPNIEAAVTFAPVHYTPLHPDTLLWGFGGELALRVNLYGWPGEGKPPTIATVEGPAAKLTPEQRLSIVLNVWGREGPEYDDHTTAERVYGGRGLRDLLWFAWYNKQLIQQAGAHYSERLARGVTIIRHAPSDEAREAARKAATAMTETYVVLWPTTGDEGTKADVEIIEPSGTGHQIFTDLWERYRSAINKAILHQELVSGTAPTGLGSGVAEVHERTFADVIQHDANTLGDTLTHELVRPLQRFNFPGQSAEYRFVFATTDDTTEMERTINTAATLAGMGVRLSERALRKAGGFDEPRPDEDTVGGDVGIGIGDLAGQLGGV